MQYRHGFTQAPVGIIKLRVRPDRLLPGYMKMIRSPWHIVSAVIGVITRNQHLSMKGRVL
jgi:hypothetical protein